MSANDFYWELAELNADAIIFEEYEDAYLGYAHRIGGLKPVAVYSYSIIVNQLAAAYSYDEELVASLEEKFKDESETELLIVEELMNMAVEYVDFNVVNTAGGEDNENGPIFVMEPQIGFDERRVE